LDIQKLEMIYKHGNMITIKRLLDKLNVDGIGVLQEQVKLGKLFVI